ncbi:villin-2-like [Telopea speciosissima]|uniref:villin-2-like n=1 Tax=Telopea speciosissima TaxID=54955 RepID=UPI001CC3B275|nr:villin-2-like [Telopea speciosissima]
MVVSTYICCTQFQWVCVTFSFKIYITHKYRFPVKLQAHGNSFAKKLFLLFGASHSSENQDRSNRSNQEGPTQRASALAALNSAFNPFSATKPAASASRPLGASQGSQRAAAVAALSNVLTAEQKKKLSSDASAAQGARSPPTNTISAEVKSVDDNSEVDAQEESPVKETEEGRTSSVSESNGEESEVKQKIQQEAPQDENGSATYSYDQVNTKSTNPVSGIDFKKRESYLSDEEFETVLEMTKEAFYRQPKWKQNMLKKKVFLF